MKTAEIETLQGGQRWHKGIFLRSKEEKLKHCYQLKENK